MIGCTYLGVEGKEVAISPTHTARRTISPLDLYTCMGNTHTKSVTIMCVCVVYGRIQMSIYRAEERQGLPLAHTR